MELSASDIIIQKRLDIVLSLLDERQRRIFLGAEAQSIGWGGVRKIHQLSGVNRKTIASGLK